MKTEKPLDSLYSFQMACCVIFRVIVRFCFAEKPVFTHISGVVHILTAQRGPKSHYPYKNTAPFLMGGILCNVIGFNIIFWYALIPAG